MSPITASERTELAGLLGIHEQYLYQCLTGKRAMRTSEAVLAEQKTGGRLRRWHLRMTDWWMHWPELIGSEGAPPIPKQKGRK